MRHYSFFLRCDYMCWLKNTSVSRSLLFHNKLGLISLFAPCSHSPSLSKPPPDKTAYIELFCDRREALVLQRFSPAPKLVTYFFFSNIPRRQPSFGRFSFLCSILSSFFQSFLLLLGPSLFRTLVFSSDRSAFFILPFCIVGYFDAYEKNLSGRYGPLPFLFRQSKISFPGRFPSLPSFKINLYFNVFFPPLAFQRPSKFPFSPSNLPTDFLLF